MSNMKDPLINILITVLILILMEYALWEVLSTAEGYMAGAS